jgi:hypothetical protein
LLSVVSLGYTHAAFLPVLENVRQRQQHRGQESFEKTYSQEISLHLAGNSCHIIN